MLRQVPHKDYDRFIPLRGYQNPSFLDFALPFGLPQKDTQYSMMIRKNLFHPNDERIINYTSQEIQMTFQPTPQFSKDLPSKNTITINSPEKILDIPNYRDDFYLNTIDWSSHGSVGIALENQVYLYTPESLIQVCKTPFSTYVSSLKFFRQTLIVGLSSGMVEIYDLQKLVLVRSLKKHADRVSALEIANNNLLTGSKDKNIHLNDLREREHLVNTFVEHRGEICTLKERSIDDYIFASGSNDCNVIVWDVRNNKEMMKYKGHKGAVKGLSWCPWKHGILATGGGNKDKSIKIWNTSTSKQIVNEKVESQVSGLLWNTQINSLISSHGNANNEVNIWNLQYTNEQSPAFRNSFGSLTKHSTFKAHNGRILNMCQSPNQNYLCTTAADQTMKFWNIRNTQANPFQKKQSHQKNQTTQQSSINSQRLL